MRGDGESPQHLERGKPRLRSPSISGVFSWPKCFRPFFRQGISVAPIDYQKLSADLGEHNMPLIEFAIVLRLDGVRGASHTRLKEALRDADANPIPLADDVAQQVLKVWTEISLLQFWMYVVAGAPIKIDLRNGERVHEWLVDLRRRMAEETNNSGAETRDTSEA